MGEDHDKGSGPLSGNRMVPWTGDDAECAAFGQAMAERGVSINQNDNRGVSPQVAYDVAHGMAERRLDATADVDDRFGRGSR